MEDLYSGALASETRDLAAHIDVALKAERQRCIDLCESWIGAFQDVKITLTEPRKYAVGAIEDIIELIRDGNDPKDVAPQP